MQKHWVNKHASLYSWFQLLNIQFQCVSSIHMLLARKVTLIFKCTVHIPEVESTQILIFLILLNSPSR